MVLPPGAAAFFHGEALREKKTLPVQADGGLQCPVLDQSLFPQPLDGLLQLVPRKTRLLVQPFHPGRRRRADLAVKDKKAGKELRFVTGEPVSGQDVEGGEGGCGFRRPARSDSSSRIRRARLMGAGVAGGQPTRKVTDAVPASSWEPGASGDRRGPVRTGPPLGTRSRTGRCGSPRGHFPAPGKAPSRDGPPPGGRPPAGTGGRRPRGTPRASPSRHGRGAGRDSPAR